MGSGIRRRGRRRIVVGTLVFALGAIFAPAAWAQSDAQVTLDFRFPPGFDETNVPANVDDTNLEEILYQQDFITTASTTLGSREESPETEADAGQGAVTTAAGAVSIGFDATLTEDLQLFTLPFAYRPRANMKLGVEIPLVRRTGDEGEVLGLGDATLSAGVRWGNPLKVLGITTAFIKAPTGDPVAEDRGEFLPLGTGSWDFALYQTFITRLGRWRAEATLGYRLNTSADFDADVDGDGADEGLEVENGDVLNLILGVDREIPVVSGLVGSVKVDTRRILQADLAIDGADQATPAAITLVDLLPGVKYFIGPGMPLHLGVRIPVNHTSDRGLALDVGIMRTF